MDCLSGHVVTQPGSQQQVLLAVQTLLRERFGITHVTVQIELEDPDPAAAPCPTVENCG